MAESSNYFASAPNHFEPINSENIQKQKIMLFPYHKRKCLEFLESEHNFINSPESYIKLSDPLVTDLNKFNSKKNSIEWLRILRAWIDFVKNPLYISDSNEDEMLRKYIAKVSKEDIGVEDLSDHCRVCLESNSFGMFHLFNEQNTDIGEVSLLDKLNYCSLTIRAADDNLPQYICKSCSILVENAYQLKLLCETAEKKYEEIFSFPITDEEISVSEVKIEMNEDYNEFDSGDNDDTSEFESDIHTEQENAISFANESII